MIFQTYYNRLTRNVEDLFDQAKIDPTEEIIHDLRVGIRKWKEADRLAEACEIRRHGQADADVTTIFRRAAMLRDAQVMLDLSKRLVGESEQYEMAFRSTLERNCAAQHRLFVEKLQTLTLQLGRIHRRVSSSVVRNRLRRSLSGGIRQILRTDMQPHALRLRIKRAKYRMEIWQKCFSDTHEVESLRRELAAVQDLIGDWHDHVVLGEVVEKFYKNRLRTGSAAALEARIHNLIDLKRMLIPVAMGHLRTCILNFGEQNVTIMTAIQRVEKNV